MRPAAAAAGARLNAMAAVRTLPIRRPTRVAAQQGASPANVPSNASCVARFAEFLCWYTSIEHGGPSSGANSLGLACHREDPGHNSTQPSAIRGISVRVRTGHDPVAGPTRQVSRDRRPVLCHRQQVLPRRQPVVSHRKPVLPHRPQVASDRAPVSTFGRASSAIGRWVRPAHHDRVACGASAAPLSIRRQLFAHQFSISGSARSTMKSLTLAPVFTSLRPSSVRTV